MVYASPHAHPPRIGLRASLLNSFFIFHHTEKRNPLFSMAYTLFSNQYFQYPI